MTLFFLSTEIYKIQLMVKYVSVIFGFMSIVILHSNLNTYVEGPLDNWACLHAMLITNFMALEFD